MMPGILLVTQKRRKKNLKPYNALSSKPKNSEKSTWLLPKSRKRLKYALGRCIRRFTRRPTMLKASVLMSVLILSACTATPSKPLPRQLPLNDMTACRPCLQKPESGDPSELIKVIVHNTECFAVCANRHQGLAKWINAGE